MDSVKTRAIVLRRTNYGEADRILSILTPEGKMSVMAKGVRKEKSKLAGGIELFSVSDVVVHRGKGELGILTSVRLVEFFPEIMKDLEAVELVGSVLKEVSRWAEQVDAPEYFDLVRQVMGGVNGILKRGVSGKMRLVRCWWEMNVRRVSGEEVNLLVDVVGERLKVDKKYSWDGMEWSLREDVCGEIGAEEIKLMRLVVTSPLWVLLNVIGAEKMMETIEVCWNSDR